MTEPAPAPDVSSYRMETIRDDPPVLWGFYVVAVLLQLAGLAYQVWKVWMW